MIKIRKSDERGHATHGWLDSHHTFSFADYYDPKHTHFRSLRVLNEDHVAPKMGFGMHPHRDMEIISYVIDGELRHRDSMGNTALMRAGDVQRISAGQGVLHSEVNDSTTKPVHFLQIWIMPDRKDAEPAYAEKSFGQIGSGKLHLIASKAGRDGSIPINQDADVYVAKLKADEGLRHAFAAGRSGWLQVIEGEVDANGSRLTAGDAAAISDIDTLKLSTARDAHFLFFDLN